MHQHVHPLSAVYTLWMSMARVLLVIVMIIQVQTRLFLRFPGGQQLPLYLAQDVRYIIDAFLDVPLYQQSARFIELDNGYVLLVEDAQPLLDHFHRIIDADLQLAATVIAHSILLGLHRRHHYVALVDLGHIVRRIAVMVDAHPSSQHLVHQQVVRQFEVNAQIQRVLGLQLLRLVDGSRKAIKDKRARAIMQELAHDGNHQLVAHQLAGSDALFDVFAVGLCLRVAALQLFVGGVAKEIRRRHQLCIEVRSDHFAESSFSDSRSSQK
mmetsp:Transcript_44385/g.71097  ORF Transcript_44385/g.71097 Transcript_44385/m.71097 type:complete len:268 (+) Transcript_44385:143-946(+)